MYSNFAGFVALSVTVRGERRRNETHLNLEAYFQAALTEDGSDAAPNVG